MAPKRRSFDDALPGVLALALALRLLPFITALPDPKRFFTLDALGYMALARDLHAGYLEPTSALWPVGLMRTPAYPIFASALLYIAADSVVTVVLGQLALGLIAIVLTHRIADAMFGRRAAILAALILALDPASAVFVNLLQPESLFTVFLLAGSIAWRKALEGAGIPTALAAGVLLGLATLTRPIGLFLPIPVLLLAAISRRDGRWLMTRSAAVLLPFALLVGGWMARNAFHTGVPVLSTIEGVNLLEYRAAGAVAVEENRAIEDVRISLREELVRRGTASNNPALHSRAQSQLAMDVLREHPYGTVRSAAEGVARLTLGTGLTALSGLRGDPDPEMVVGPLEHLLQALFALLLGVSYLAATLGVVWLIRKRDFASLATVAVFLLYFVLISAGPEANTRFRIPAMPFIAILAGVGLARLQKPDSRDPANLRL